MFTVATALTRLAAGPWNLFITANGTMSAGQQLQRINEVLEIFYTEGSWRGVREEVALTSSSGIITLSSTYLRLDGLSVSTDGREQPIDIKGPEWKFQPNGPGVFNVTEGCASVAIDLGDNASGVRRYQLVGATATLDALTYSGLGRKRFNWITDTATVVTPDCYAALELGVRAKHAADNQANDLSKDLWGQAFGKLDADLGEFMSGNEWGAMQVDAGSFASSYNAV